MSSRYPENLFSLLPRVKIRFSTALKEKFKEGYSFSDFKADIFSGMVVGLVAIPLGMALAIASGVPPQHGLYTVIIGGGIVALLGGSRFQVTGPTAAFVVILTPIVGKYGLGGLLLAGCMAGIMLVIMGCLRLGQFIQFIPYTVTTGFTAGIALVIATLQLKDFLGLTINEMPAHFHSKVMTLFHALPTMSPHEFTIGMITLIGLILWPKLNKRLPAPLIVLSTVSLVVIISEYFFPELKFATIQNRFSGIPDTLPQFNFPSNFSLRTIEALLPSAFAIAMLGAIESLLSAVVADAMAQTTHDPDAELIALGIGNIVCPFFGGIAATGAIARTATNIRFGARSPLSAFFHALFTLTVILFFSPIIAKIPMAALAALLLTIAYHMSEIKSIYHIVGVAPKSDVFVFLLCFLLTVLFDMVVGVSIGIVLASLLFMRQMAELTTSKVTHEKIIPIDDTIPSDVLLYEIAGPLFFGAAKNAIEATHNISDDIRCVIFVMNEVPVMDVTGLVALESAIRKIKSRHHKVYLVGVKDQPKKLIEKSLILMRHARLCDTVGEAVKRSRSKLTLQA